MRVDEGVIDVDGTLMYDGESILVTPDGGKTLALRTILVGGIDGMKVFRAKVHKLLKHLKLNETPQGLGFPRSPLPRR